MANHDPPDPFDPAITATRSTRPCRPREITRQMQATINDALPDRADPSPPITSPPGSVMIGTVRVGVMKLPDHKPAGTPRAQGKPEPEPPPQQIGERWSSVPDAHSCDPRLR